MKRTDIAQSLIAIMINYSETHEVPSYNKSGSDNKNPSGSAVLALES